VPVDGAGLVRNLVTDPYSVSLTTDSKRSYIAAWTRRA
jgi:pullulanase